MRCLPSLKKNLAAGDAATAFDTATGVPGYGSNLRAIALATRSAKVGCAQDPKACITAAVGAAKMYSLGTLAEGVEAGEILNYACQKSQACSDPDVEHDWTQSLSLRSQERVAEIAEKAKQIPEKRAEYADELRTHFSLVLQKLPKGKWARYVLLASANLDATEPSKHPSGLVAKAILTYQKIIKDYGDTTVQEKINELCSKYAGSDAKVRELCPSVPVQPQDAMSTIEGRKQYFQATAAAAKSTPEKALDIWTDYQNTINPTLRDPKYTSSEDISMLAQSYLETTRLKQDDAILALQFATISDNKAVIDALQSEGFMTDLEIRYRQGETYESRIGIFERFHDIAKAIEIWNGLLAKYPKTANPSDETVDLALFSLARAYYYNYSPEYKSAACDVFRQYRDYGLDQDIKQQITDWIDEKYEKCA
ncbi:hypothetical protein HY642_00930 [Candidatus Woesearchaeota archaeon]|nr:hypothetical protein [Candidatus Woesearchaeota archaeon]